MNTVSPDAEPDVPLRPVRVVLLEDPAGSFAATTWRAELERMPNAELVAVVGPGSDPRAIAPEAADLLLAGAWTDSQVPWIVWAFSRGWHVATNELFSFDRQELEDVAGLARQDGRVLIAGLANGFLAVPPDLVDPSGALGPVTRIDVSWERPAPPDEQEPSLVALVRELAPRLLAIALPYLRGAAPKRVRVTVTAPTVTIGVLAADDVPLIIRLGHRPPSETEPDRGVMIVHGKTQRVLELGPWLTGGYVAQLHRSVDFVSQCLAAARAAERDGTVVAYPEPVVWVDPPTQVLDLMGAILTSMALNEAVDLG